MIMRSQDDYERIRTALMEVAMVQSNALDRERWFALALACPDVEAERPEYRAREKRAPSRGWVPMSVLRRLEPSALHLPSFNPSA